MPADEQKKLHYREFLRRFGALARTFYTKTPLLPEPRETVSGAKSCPAETVGAILHSSEVQHMTTHLCFFVNPYLLQTVKVFKSSFYHC